jgi:hypothetical protein
MHHPSCKTKTLNRALAAAAGGLALFAGVPAQADEIHLPARFQPGSATTSFTRMFPLLPPFALQTDENREQAKRLGEIGGPLDALDNLSDPIQSIVNQPVFSPNNPDNSSMTAGVTFIGQFLDHDITLDPKSKILENSTPRSTTNFRTPAFDLDSLYGGGPDTSPELYETSSGDYLFKIEAIPGSEAVSRNGATRYDVPRDAAGNAIVAESRNDENTIVSQLQLAMLRFHNNVVAHLRADPANADASAKAIFNQARQTVRWHYQWIIVHEFLPLTIGQSRVDSLLSSVRSTSSPQIPIEFSVAAYRFGHSQVRPSYRLNFGPSGGSPFFAFVFDDSIDPAEADPNDLRGGKRAPRRFVDWQTFFDFGDGNFRPNKRIDAKLSSVLMHLPGSRAPTPGLPSDGIQSLASRNLMRHVNFGIPSGQAIAKRIGATALTPAQLPELASYDMDRSTPLWYYVLKEADVMESGQKMGPVGGHIVGTVFIQLLKSDTSAYLRAAPNWTPTLPSATAGDFRVTDLLKFAGVVPPL